MVGENRVYEKADKSRSQNRYAENIRVSVDENGTFGSISPIEDPELISPNMFNGDEVLHSVSVRDISAVFTRNQAAGRTNIYRISKDVDALAVKKVVSLEMLISDHISTVIRYEDSDNVKLYWADGENSIRVANIAINEDVEAANISQSNPSYFNIIPESSLSKPTIDSVSSGSLMSGKIQYVYQLYNESGSSTALSHASDLIDLLPGDGIGGGLSDVYGMPANKSVRIKIDLPETKFKGIKLYSIYYYNLSVTPQIPLVREVVLPVGESVIYIVDSGSTTLME